MNKGFSNLLNNLVNISPRRGKGEQDACRVLIRELNRLRIPFTLQKFNTKIPTIINAVLFADDRQIECVGASFVSGTFDKNSPILSSFGAVSDKPAIIFSPVSQGICLQSHKPFPAVAVNRDSIVELIIANKISGVIEVAEEEFESTNILVGNLVNPRKIVFAHYDSIVGSGAIDNAGSVDVVFQTIQGKPNLIERNLFVFAGSEEESITRPDGCYGFEIFDKEYKQVVDGAIELIVLDGVGVGNPSFVNNNVDWVFYVDRINELSNKILWLQNDQTKVMNYYHTRLDTLDKLDVKYLEEAKDMLIKRLLDNVKLT